MLTRSAVGLAVLAFAAGGGSAQLLPGVATGTPGEVRALLKPLCHLSPDDAPGPLRGGWDVVLLTQDDLDELNARRGKPVAVVRSGGGNADGAASRMPGLTVVFNAFGDVTQDAMDAMQITADYYASRIDDPITVTFNANFASSSFGGAAPLIVTVPYAEYLDLLSADADADDTIQNLLPLGTFPARRSFGGAVSQESTVALTTANARALGLDFDVDADAELFVSSEADGDPSDGIGNGAAAPNGQFVNFSLADILVHEVGHSLGFINVIEFGAFEATGLDLHRFAELGPDNPSTDAEFTAFPRALYVGGGSAAEQHQFDFIDREYLASNASDFQASHFRETNFGDPTAPRVGVMEPAITSFETGFPEYFSVGDFDAFDAIGWDYVGASDCLADTNGNGQLDPGDFTAWVAAFNAGDLLADQNANGVLDPGDFTAWVSNFNAGCP